MHAWHLDVNVTSQRESLSKNASVLLDNSRSSAKIRVGAAVVGASALVASEGQTGGAIAIINEKGRLEVTVLSVRQYYDMRVSFNFTRQGHGACIGPGRSPGKYDAGCLSCMYTRARASLPLSGDSKNAEQQQPLIPRSRAVWRTS